MYNLWSECLDSAWALVSFLKYLLMLLLMRMWVSRPQRNLGPDQTMGDHSWEWEKGKRKRKKIVYKKRRKNASWNGYYFIAITNSWVHQSTDCRRWRRRWLDALETTTALIEMKERPNPKPTSHYHLSCGGWSGTSRRSPEPRTIFAQASFAPGVNRKLHFGPASFSFLLQSVELFSLHPLDWSFLGQVKWLMTVVLE